MCWESLNVVRLTLGRSEAAAICDKCLLSMYKFLVLLLGELDVNINYYGREYLSCTLSFHKALTKDEFVK